MASTTPAGPPGPRASKGFAAAVLAGHGQHPYRSLAVVFGLWKAFLLGVAVVSMLAGPAYDTSGDLLEAAANANGANASMATAAPGHAVPSGGVVSRLTSWDAIYYVQAARRGRLYEQEWAFGAALPAVVALLRAGLAALGVDAPVAAVAVAYVHAAHLLAVFLLYKLGTQLWAAGGGDGGVSSASGRTVAFVAACLHVLSPAGLFLSAPYAESSCALFSFAGYVAYAAGRTRDAARDAAAAPTLAGDALRLLAGACFGAATLFRSNGLLNGVVFACEAAAGLRAFLRRPALPVLRRLVALGLGGLAVAAGSVVPQTVAYLQFCRAPSGVPGEAVRPWCNDALPSIYNFVQGHYWDSGRLFAYWKVSNVPLFLLATPMLLVMARSSLDVWRRGDGSLADPRLAMLVRCMAASQLLLAAMTFTSYHVQIVSRLSSAYPVWYWWLAQGVAAGKQDKQGKTGNDGLRPEMARKLVVFFVMYASIQGILFASFLPPA